jgi:peroxiredoxin
MVLAEDLHMLRRFQTDVAAAGFDVVDSYVSLTEISEYAQGVPDEMKERRLHPGLPPADKPAWCFYPMSKRRTVGQNWFTLPYERRKELMLEHGASGRNFAGRILQIITGSTGLDDHEWGVTLFAERPDDLKEVVYTMRFDEASAEYAEFGTFYTGMVVSVDDLVASLGIGA